MLNGTKTSWPDLLKSFIQLCDANEHIHLLTKPTEINLEELIEAIKCLRNNRTFGTDCLPPELFKISPRLMATFLLPMFQKAYLHLAEPLQFKGGVIHDIYKGSGSPFDCPNNRGVFLFDVLAKTYHRIIRSRLLPSLENYATETMCGGIKARGTDIAYHILLSTIQYAQLKRKSLLLYYVDIVAAFDSILHSHLVDLPATDETICYLFSVLNLPPESFQEFLSIAQSTCAMHQANVDTHLSLVVKDTCTNNWFLINNDPHPNTINTGTKQGNPLADILFNFVASKIFKSIQNELNDAGLGCKIESTTNTFLGHTKEHTLTDTDYVDDQLYYDMPNDNTHLIDHMSRMAKIIHIKLLAHGLKPNYKAGKSEMQLFIRGPGSQEVKFQIYNVCKQILRVEITPNTFIDVRVVPIYKYLGNKTSNVSTYRVAAKFRASQAFTTLHSLSSKVFRSPHLKPHTKHMLATSLIMSRNYYNTCVWPRCETNVYNILQGPIVNTCKALSNINYQNILPVSDQALLYKHQFPPVEIQLRKLRLTYLPRFLAVAPTPLLSLVAALHNDNDSWINLIINDLQWLSIFSKNPYLYTITTLIEITTLVNAPAFKRHITEAVKYSTLLFEPDIGPQIQNNAVGNVVCPLCTKICVSIAALHGHNFQTHGLQNGSIPFATQNGTCPACLKCYHNRARLIRSHLSRKNHRCLRFLLSVAVAPHPPLLPRPFLTPLTIEQIQEMNSEDAATLRTRRAAGLPRVDALGIPTHSYGPLLPGAPSRDARIHRRT